MKIYQFVEQKPNCSLSELSWDKTHKVSLIEDKTHKACNLDTLTQKAHQTFRHGQKLESCDAYLERNGTHWFIEFKNQPPDNIDEQEIWLKAYDSVSTVSIVSMAVKQIRMLDNLCQNSEFLVVYQDEEPKTEDAIERENAELAEMEHIRWGLRKIVGKLYREVHTIPAKEFREKWIPRIWGDNLS